MTQPDPSTSDHLQTPPVALPLVLLLFVGSGCAALIDEIVWFQLLEFVIGSSGVSLGLLLGTFMGGMCLGSWALPRLVSRRWHPLRVFALLELGIAGLAVAIISGLPSIGRVYLQFAGHGWHDMLLRGLLCSLCLLPPAAFMGATLPAIARWVELTPRGVGWLGYFYGGNTVGGMLGSVTAGFYLLRLYDLLTATYVAVAIHATVAAIALVLARAMPQSIATDNLPPSSNEDAPHGRTVWPVYFAVGLSGLTALGAEVIWTRLFSLVLGGTTYTFSIILAVFLGGLSIGSSVGARLASRIKQPSYALGMSQWLLTAAIAWTSLLLGWSAPSWPFSSPAPDPWTSFALDVLRCSWAILPAACLWGASFSLALASVAAPGQDSGRVVGGVYAANTIGAIVGTATMSLLLVPALGTQICQRLLIGVAALAAVSVWLPLLWQPGSGLARNSIARLFARGVPLAMSLTTAGLLAWSVQPVPIELLAYGREARLATPFHITELYRGEGVSSSIAVTEKAGARYFHVSGKVEASTELADMRVERMLGNLPALLHPDPNSVLVVGFGAGVTAGSLLPFFDVQRLVICEIEPLIPQHVAPYFDSVNHNVLADPTVEVVYDDARHYILTTGERFDIITSDPIHPYVKGAATLYTREYFEQVRAHLKPGGLVSQWIPLYESNLSTVKSELATFLEVFPNCTAWSNTNAGGGYDLVLLGSVEPLVIDLDELHKQLRRPTYQFASYALREVGFKSELDLLATYTGQGSDWRIWLADAEINRDMNLRLQYLAGIVPPKDARATIHQELLRFRTDPVDLFRGSGKRVGALKKMLAEAK